jgi:hypothetical protein
VIERLPIAVIVEMRSRSLSPLSRIGTAVCLLFVVQGFCAPASAWAGCNHEVTSQTDAARSKSRSGTLLPSLLEPTDAAPQPVRPCTEAWCSGQPATPGLPAKVFDRGLGSWAWWTFDITADATLCSFESLAPNLFRPLYTSIAVFHPPRLFSFV